MQYTFKCYGHPHLLAKHVKTLEFTKDEEITERADCIVGLRAEFELEELKKFSKKIKVVCSVKTLNGEVLSSEFKCKVSPHFNSNHELVLRKSGFSSDRTFGVGLNRGSNRMDRDIVELMKNPGQVMKVTISEGWA